MGQRLPELSQSWADLAARGYDKQADAARIAASGKAALGQGIANGLAQITTAMLRKKENARADSIRAEANARQDARDAKADARYDRSEARDLERDQRSRDEFMLRHTEGKRSELAERLRVGDVSAQGEWESNERTAQTLTARLMRQNSNVMPDAETQDRNGFVDTPRPNRPTPIHDKMEALYKRGKGPGDPEFDAALKEVSASEASGHPISPVFGSPGRHDTSVETSTGANSAKPNASPSPSVKPDAPVSRADEARGALGSAMDKALAEREARLRDHAKSDAIVKETEDALEEAQKRLSKSKTPAGTFAAQGEIKDLTRRLSLARETAKIDAAHAVAASRMADQVAETDKRVNEDERRAAEIAKKQADEMIGLGDLSPEVAQGLDASDFNDENVRRNVSRLYAGFKTEREFEEKKRLEQMRLAEKPTAAQLDSKTIADMRKVVEETPILGISDASGLSGKTLENLHAKAVRAREADERAAASKSENDRRFGETEKNGLRRELTALYRRVAAWDNDGPRGTADFEEGTPQHQAYWAAKGKIADLEAKLDDSDDDAPAKDDAKAAWDKLTPEQQAEVRRRAGRR